MRANPEIDALLAELLDSGVSPKYVSRLAGELADHQADLEAEAARFGLPGQEAAADAKLRLGDCSVIAKEFALRPELKSWVYRCRWLEPLLRFVVAGYLLVRAPARLVAAGQAAMLRYTAATAAGASVTCCLLLMLTALVPPSGAWSVRLVEQAGAALGGWELERPRRYRHRDAWRGGAWDERTAVPARTAPAVTRREASRDVRTAPPAAEEQPSEPRALEGGGERATEHAVLPDESPRLVRNGERLQPAELRGPAELHALAQSSYERSARVILGDAEPAVQLGFEHLLGFERGAHDEPTRELAAVFKVPPVYPLAAARRGLEGHVIIEYTVTRTGTVKDPVVVESSHPLFNRAALDAAREFKYSPRVIRGKAVDVHGVRVLIRFELGA